MYASKAGMNELSCSIAIDLPAASPVWGISAAAPAPATPIFRKSRRDALLIGGFSLEAAGCRSDGCCAALVLRLQQPRKRVPAQFGATGLLSITRMRPSLAAASRRP